MNEYDRFILEDVLPLTEDLIEQIYETGKIVLKSAGNALTRNGLSGGIDAIEALRLKRHEQNIRKLLANINNAEDIKDFIKKANEKQKEFMTQVLIKTANLENDIQIFIMARLVQNMTDNGSLTYYESSLFVNINSLTYEDFEIYYKIYTNLTHNKNHESNLSTLTTAQNNSHYKTIISKYENIGILSPSGAVWDQYSIKNEELTIHLQKNDYSDIFFNYLKEYFERD